MMPDLSTAYIYLSQYYRELGNLYFSYQYGQKAIEEAHRIGKKRSLMWLITIWAIDIQVWFH